MAVLADPEGAVFSVWEARSHKGATIVNEHGALNFNSLATRDPEAAKAFYGTVFGWRTLALPLGEMWTLPGYGDHLEERTPGLRQQVAQMGGPEGFIDVVAALAPIAADDSAAPAHWSVTFAVDDAESTAAKARELGGQVVSGPFDAPWTRRVVIKDPQGAMFIASQFVPENKDLGA
jgi:predicted enzyme related to lactoylglutathione lyase